MFRRTQHLTSQGFRKEKKRFSVRFLFLIVSYQTFLPCLLSFLYMYFLPNINAYYTIFLRYQDQNTSVVIMVLGCSKWLGVRLEVLCSLLVTLVAAGAVFITQLPGKRLLSSSFSFSLPPIFFSSDNYRMAKVNAGVGGCQTFEIPIT